jgi:opacity protein-like surface antigen
MRILPFRFFASLVLAVPAVFLAPRPAMAQTDAALSGYGAFAGTTSADGIQQSPANQAGGLVEVRHIANPLLGFEGAYSFNRANQTYRTGSVACPADLCASGTVSVSSNAHQFTGDWVPSMRVRNLRPFAVLGVGLLLDVPTTGYAAWYNTCAGLSCCLECAGGSVTTTVSQTRTQSSVRAVYVYGAGLDWKVLPHIGLRLQYRGNLYQAPQLTKAYPANLALTHTAEPMAGVYFRF